MARINAMIDTTRVLDEAINDLQMLRGNLGIVIESKEETLHADIQVGVALERLQELRKILMIQKYGFLREDF